MAHFSKKHYESIAQLLRETKPRTTEHRPSMALRECYHGEMAQWSATVLRFSELFQADNSRFDAERFHDAVNEEGSQ